MLTFDAIATLGVATLVLIIGYYLQQHISFLRRYNLPTPVIGGLVIALLLLLGQQLFDYRVKFDNSARTPLMLAFFTSLGFAASLRLLKIGGRFVLIFLALSIIAAILQNVVGATAAHLMGLPALFGVLCGSVTLTGGPATGLAFAPQFEQAGIAGAEAIAVAAAMCGIIMGGVFGGPIGTWLLTRLQRDGKAMSASSPTSVLDKLHHSLNSHSDTHLLSCFGLIIMAMWLGSWVSAGFIALGLTLPAYIGAMIVAAILRNLNDYYRIAPVNPETVDTIGSVALAYFLALSLMTLELAKLSTVAIPILVLISIQVVLIATISAVFVFRYMGKDYEAAVTATGFYGFMMGTTANAMANMEAFVRRYSPAPRAYLVVPIVGAFFIDFANTFIVQLCLVWLR
ncbi:sodium/glutamate symporter [Agitococcus lubricus]|uniref:Sodium/glutamate symporter n=1 Tax=Agitococcus lubricus TaxID=1077255 RepID=A0A2T5J176_9GAMM|nr:sodium/glutamate symporter [Agitococcus lubricus]PTQ90148.1 ESS family glutamate:Na+ symporter [Agitococcus lubricus]